MIKLVNLTKSYQIRGKRNYVFKNVNFTFPKGKNIAVLGRNGSGKSTLMRLLGQVEQPDKGYIETDSYISWPISLAGGFQPTMTGRDNIKFLCRVFGYSGERLKEKVREIEEFVELGEYFDEPVRKYSSGMNARLKFGITFVFEYDYYLIDEVTAVGDQQFKDKSAVYLKKKLLKANLILVSHSVAYIRELCDAVVIVGNNTLTLYDDLGEGIEVYKNL